MRLRRSNWIKGGIKDYSINFQRRRKGIGSKSHYQTGFQQEEK